MTASIYTNQIFAYRGGNITDVSAANIDSQVDVDTRRVLQSDFPASTATGLTYSCTFVGLLFGGQDWPGIERMLATATGAAGGLFSVVRTARDAAVVWENPTIVGRELSHDAGGYIQAVGQVRQAGRIYRCEAKQLSSGGASVNVNGAAFVVASYDFVASDSSLTVGSASVNVSSGMGVAQIAGLTAGTATASYQPADGELWLLGGTEVSL